MGRRLSSPARLAAAAILAAGLALLAQRGGRFRERESAAPAWPVRNGEYHFLRLEFTDLARFHRGFGFASRSGSGSGWWMVDWPDADQHFTTGVSRLTRIDLGEPRHLRLDDPKLFDYPWLYATQACWWDLSEQEVARLREYLLRGGFLVVDDIWGAEARELFAASMKRVLPERDMIDVAQTDSLMHVLYDIEDKDRTWIPGSRHLRRRPGAGAEIVQPPGTHPDWKALLDARDRVIVAVNLDTDVGDAWEFADDPEYPERMTSLAYRFGVNYIVYAMTH
jgi:hypothetical protein